MPAPVLVSKIVLLARQRANQETLDQSQALATDQELTEAANYYLAHVWRKLVRARGSDYYRKSPNAVLVTVPGTATYVLPGDFFELVGVDWIRGPNDVVRLMPFQEDERNVYQNNVGWVRNARNARIMYQLQAQRIALIPVPTSVETLQLLYIPSFPTLNFGDSFDGVAGFEDFAVWKIASQLALKDENFPLAQMCSAEAEKIEGEIVTLAPRRDLGGPQRVVRSKHLRRRADNGW